MEGGLPLGNARGSPIGYNGHPYVAINLPIHQLENINCKATAIILVIRATGGT
jgi:hypothetical protein